MFLAIQVMNSFNELRAFLNSLFMRGKTNKRVMKRVFQWQRYLDWKELTSEEKLSAKRFLLVPFFAYLLISIFNQNFLLIVSLLIGYVLYKKFQKGGILKK